MKRTLLIGGAGFIGRALARILAPQREVHVLDCAAEPPAPWPDGVRYRCGDFATPALLAGELEGMDEVVHLAYASVPKTSYEHPVEDVTLNLPPAVSLFEELKGRKLAKVVLLSSGGTVYGEAQYLPIDEQHPTHPISPYGITKLTLEKYGLMYWHHAGLPLVIVRPGNPFGEGQLPFRGQGFVATAIASALQGGEITCFGKKGVIRDYLHVEDVALGIVAALDAGHPGEVYNIGSGHGHSNQDILDALSPLAEKAGRPLRVVEAPARPFDVQANVLDIRKLGADTGWRPRLAFEAALVRTWNWLAYTWRP